MSTATARAYQPRFAGRFVPFEMQKSPQNKAFYGQRSTYSGKAHCIKDRVLLDPCCGSGGMFVQSETFVENHSGNINNLSIYGQEANADTWKMAKINMAIRGIEPNFGPHQADTFIEIGRAHV